MAPSGRLLPRLTVLAIAEAVVSGPLKVFLARCSHAVAICASYIVVLGLAMPNALPAARPLGHRNEDAAAACDSTDGWVGSASMHACGTAQAPVDDTGHVLQMQACERSTKLSIMAEGLTFPL